MHINNDIDIFNPLKNECGTTGNTFVLAAAPIVGLSILLGVQLSSFLFFLGAVGMGAGLLYLFFRAMINGNYHKQLGSTVKRQQQRYYPHEIRYEMDYSAKYKAFRDYRALPKEVKDRINVLTIDDFVEMTNDEANEVKSAIDSLAYEWEEHNRLLATPKVKEFVASIRTEADAYRHNNQTMRSING